MNDYRCASGQRCVALTSSGPAIVHRDTICHRCCQSVQVQLDELPNILSVLPLFKSRLGGESGEAKVRSSKDAPAPLNVAVVDLDTDIRVILEHVTVRVVDLASHEDGVWWIGAIRKAYSQADKLIGISRHFSPRFAKCPTCDLRCLGSFAGEDSVHCSSCGEVLTLAEYSSLCIKVAREK